VYPAVDGEVAAEVIRIRADRGTSPRIPVSIQHQTQRVEAVPVGREPGLEREQVGLTFPRVAERLFLVGELAELLRMDTDDVLAGTVATQDATQVAPAGVTVAVTSTERLAQVLAVARTRRLVRGLREDDVVADEHPDAPRVVVARLLSDLATIAQQLTG